MSVSGYWTPKLNQKFREALDDAFDEASIDLLTSDYFGLSFAKISPAGFGKTFAYRMQEVVNQAKLDDWLLDLVAAARERRPKNALLAAVAEDLGLTIAGPRLINHTGTPLQALLNANAKSIKPAAFREKLAQLEGQVCWVRIPGGGGTGFLVGADLVVTNYHVMAPVLNKKVSPADVVCQFDYRDPIDGPALKRKKLTEVKLHADPWLVDQRPPSDFDWDPELGDAAASEADYALLRLEEEIGDWPVGGATADTGAAKRGWICTNTPAPALVGGNLVFLLQHPKGEPLQLTVGLVKQFNASGTRVRHDANSKEGSSGSPCFDADLELVALHHAHDPADPPQWNQAIPFGWIQKLWSGNATVSALLGAKPCP